MAEREAIATRGLPQTERQEARGMERLRREHGAETVVKLKGQTDKPTHEGQQGVTPVPTTCSTFPRHE